MSEEATDSAKSDLRNKLANSPAMRSLVMEQGVGKALQGRKWTVSQSTYYIDLEENKIREIDVLAEQRWMIPRDDDQERDFLNLHLVIECKSAKGYHLLFGPEIGLVAEFSDKLHRAWLGYEDNSALVAQTLAAGQLSEAQVACALQDFFDIAAPDGKYRNLALDISPPGAVSRASAFRETNIGHEKDLDTSVLWRASLALMSAVESLKRNSVKWKLEKIRYAADRAKKDAEELGIEPSGTLATVFINALEEVHIFHPIVVIDSMLWKAESAELESLNWCRLKFTISGGSDWWCDVVQVAHFTDYATAVTKHYVDYLAGKQAERMGI